MAVQRNTGPHMLMWVLSNISVSWYPLSLKECIKCFPKMQSSYLSPIVSSPVIFRLLTNVLTVISWIVSGAACPNLQCYVFKVAGCRFVCDTNTVGVLDMVSIAYRQPHRLTVMITALLTDLTHAYLNGVAASSAIWIGAYYLWVVSWVVHVCLKSSN